MQVAPMASNGSFDIVRTVEPMEVLEAANERVGAGSQRRSWQQQLFAASSMASLLRVAAVTAGHFDDPASATCVIHAGEPMVEQPAESVHLFCRERFVVTNLELVPL